jgi:type III secretion protein R
MDKVGRCAAIAVVAITTILAPATAQAQMVGDSTSPLALVALLAGMALLPFALIMVTSFVKVAVVLSILRTAIGAQQVPPNQIITGLAIVLSIYIMAPVGEDMYVELEPHLQAHEAGELELTFASLEEITTEVGEPLRQFLLRHADEEDRLLLHELALEMRDEDQRERIGEEDFLILVPAFVVTELKRAFTIGFILFVPFIVIDLVVANILLSLGMHMLSPTTISLPFKLLLFVLVDGWYLVVQGLILGYV